MGINMSDTSKFVAKAWDSRKHGIVQLNLLAGFSYACPMER
jgi:hypothetical protein